MQFLITGTAGFIGYHLALRLLDQGHAVIGFDGMTEYYDLALKRARVERLRAFTGYRHVVGMLEEPGALDNAIGADRPEIVIHLAAQAGVRYSMKAPEEYIHSNLVGSWNVLEFARKLQPVHLLLASTSSIYGANEGIPFSEHDKADEPLNLYAATKKGMEVMAFSYAQLFAIPTTALRFFTVYGPWGRPDMALFKFVAAIRNGQPIDVHGAGEMARDFTYIDDVVEAVARLIPIAPDEDNRVSESGFDTLSTAAPYRTVNIANGAPVKLTEFIEIIERALGRKAKRNLLPVQPGEMPVTFGDSRLLHALTGFAPEVGLEHGVGAFVDWYGDYFGRRTGVRALQ
jgi:UDP-glucuronate 4-epimerase